MAQWIAVATATDLARRRKTAAVERRRRRPSRCSWSTGTVYAFARHLHPPGASLSKGTLLNGKVICPGHQWKFDLETGEAEDQDRCQPTYPVRVGRRRHRSSVSLAAAASSAAPAGREPGMTSGHRHRRRRPGRRRRRPHPAPARVRRPHRPGRRRAVRAPTSGRRCPRSTSPAGRTTSCAASYFPRRGCDDNDVELRTGTAVTRVDAGDTVRRNSRTDAASIADAVLFATGGRARRLPGVEGERVHYLRTLADARTAARATLGPGRRLIVDRRRASSASRSRPRARSLGAEVTVFEAGRRAAGRGPSVSRHRRRCAPGCTATTASTCAPASRRQRDPPGRRRGHRRHVGGSRRRATSSWSASASCRTTEVAAALRARVDNGIVVDAQGRTAIAERVRRRRRRQPLPPAVRRAAAGRALRQRQQAGRGRRQHHARPPTPSRRPALVLVGPVRRQHAVRRALRRPADELVHPRRCRRADELHGVLPPRRRRCAARSRSTAART